MVDDLPVVHVAVGGQKEEETRGVGARAGSRQPVSGGGENLASGDHSVLEGVQLDRRRMVL